MARHIGTNIYIREDQMDKDGTIINHPKAEEYNIKLRNILNLYEQKMIDLPRAATMSMKELIGYLRQVDMEEGMRTFCFITTTDIYIDEDQERIDAAMRMVLEELERDTF